MKIAYSELLQNFEYDDKNGCWIRKEDGAAFNLFEKDANDMIKIAQIFEEEAIVD